VEVDNFPFWAPIDFHQVAGHNTLIAPRIAVTRDTRDSILRPTEGNFLELGFEYGFGTFDFPIVTIEDSQFFTLYQRPDGSGRHVLSVRGLAGVAGDDTPLFERFYAGGFRTMRGFDFRGVGPEKMGFKVGGKFELLGSVEYQIPILASDNVYAVVFSDFGTVEEDVEIKDFRVSVGGGLRLIVPMFGPVPIALDWGYPVVKKDTDERQIFSFWVGFFR
jgi:outer membrane protein insertion porin family